MRIRDWSSDVCSSDLARPLTIGAADIGLAGWWGKGLPRHRSVAGLRGRPATLGLRHGPDSYGRSEESRVGKEWAVRVDLGGRRILKKKNTRHVQSQHGVFYYTHPPVNRYHIHT